MRSQNTILISITGLLAMLFLSACTPVEQQNDKLTTKTTVASGSPWSVTLEKSGGFAGVMQSITLDQTGTAVFTDQKTKFRAEKQLDANELQTSAAAVKSLATKAETAKRFSQCRDCFNYTLITTSDQGKQKFITDDIQMPQSVSKDLIQMLNNLASTMQKSK